MFKAIVFFTTLLLFTGPIRAQVSTENQKPSPEALALVRELPSQNSGSGFVQLIGRRLLTALPERNGMTAENARKLVTDVLLPEFRAALPELEATMAGIWSTRFTSPELHQLLDFARNRSAERERQFLTTPLGKKYVAQQADINQAHGQAASEWAQRVSVLSFAKNADLVRSMGVDPFTGEKFEKTDRQ